MLPGGRTLTVSFVVPFYAFYAPQRCDLRVLVLVCRISHGVLLVCGGWCVVRHVCRASHGHIGTVVAVG